MKKGKRRLLYLLLLVAVAGLLLVLALPTLIRANIASRLDAAGLRLEQFELAGPGLAETRVRRALIGSDDGSRYEIDNLVARYSLDGLMLGRLEQVTADELSIRPSTQTQPLTELLQALFGLMEQDLNTAMPVDRLHLERIRFALGNKQQLDASLTVQKTGRTLVAEMRFATPEKPLLRFSQQEAGRWLLEASNREEDAFAAALQLGTPLALLTVSEDMRAWLEAARQDPDVYHDEDLGSYLAAVLFRTVADFPDQDVARAVAEEALANILTEPAEKEAGKVSRRGLLTGLRAS